MGAQRLARIITSLQPVTASTKYLGARGMLKQLIIIGVLGLGLAGCQSVAQSQTQEAREDFAACKNLSFEAAPRS